MKLKHIFYTAAAMAMLSFQACTLDEDTSGISNPDDFFRKFSECQSVVNGCYIPIKSIYTYTYMIATECVTDIAYCPSGTLDASLDISPAVPRMGSTVCATATSAYSAATSPSTASSAPIKTR